jgi:hypothetical protein
MGENNKVSLAKSKMIIGSVVLIIGFLSPLLIPLVTATTWSVGLKTTVSGLLAFGVPEVFMLLGVAVMGKPGYEMLKKRVLNKIKYLAPDEVSLTRHRIGLILFFTPIAFGIFYPYLEALYDSIQKMPIWVYVMGDLIFLSSFIVLGGNFWDKLKGLFVHGGKAI